MLMFDSNILLYIKWKWLLWMVFIPAAAFLVVLLIDSWVGKNWSSPKSPHKHCHHACIHSASWCCCVINTEVKNIKHDKGPKGWICSRGASEVIQSFRSFMLYENEYVHCIWFSWCWITWLTSYLSWSRGSSLKLVIKGICSMLHGVFICFTQLYNVHWIVKKQHHCFL